MGYPWKVQVLGPQRWVSVKGFRTEAEARDFRRDALSKTGLSGRRVRVVCAPFKVTP